MKPITLYSYAISQSSEKLRWALDLSGIAYEERRLTPFLHRPLNASPGGGLLSSIPVIEGDGVMLDDSTRILEWLAEHRRPFQLIPQDPRQRQQVMRRVARFDQLGSHLLRWVYAEMLRQPPLALTLWSVDSGSLNRAGLRLSFPLVRRVFEQGLGFDKTRLEYSRRVIDLAVAELDGAAEAGAEFLECGRLTAADLTAAAMLVPLACAAQHPLYSQRSYQSAMQAAIEPWRQRPGMEWVRQLYRGHRPASTALPARRPGAALLRWRNRAAAA